MIDIKKLEKAVPEPLRGLIPSLLKGIDRQDLDSAIGSLLGISTTPEQNQLARMNLIGGLRAAGFIVEGGRSNRQLPYRVVEWLAKIEMTPASEWKGEARDILDELESLSSPLHLDEMSFIDVLARSKTTSHLYEASWGYIRCYELARDLGYTFVDPDGHIAIIVKKFANSPRLRIVNIDCPIDTLERLAKQLAPASLRAVKIINVDPSLLAGRQGTFERNEQAFYDVQYTLNHREDILGEKNMSKYRRDDRTCTWTASTHRDHERQIVDAWRVVNEPKQRQLGITRDYIAIDDLPLATHFIVYRDGLPVSVNIVADHADLYSNAWMIEKGLNYSSMPGGKSGTTNFGIFKLFEYLHSRGIQWLAGGNTMGGNPGMREHKQKLMAGQLMRFAVTWIPIQRHLQSESVLRGA